MECYYLGLLSVFSELELDDMSKGKEPIKFVAEVYKVQTLVDGGIRITLDLPENAIMQMAQLAECHRAGVALQFEAKPV